MRKWFTVDGSRFNLVGLRPMSLAALLGPRRTASNREENSRHRQTTNLRDCVICVVRSLYARQKMEHVSPNTGNAEKQKPKPPQTKSRDCVDSLTADNHASGGGMCPLPGAVGLITLSMFCIRYHNDLSTVLRNVFT